MDDTSTRGHDSTAGTSSAGVACVCTEATGGVAYTAHSPCPFESLDLKECVLKLSNVSPSSTHTQDSFLDEGFILDKRIGVGQPKRVEDAKWVPCWACCARWAWVLPWEDGWAGCGCMLGVLWSLVDRLPLMAAAVTSGLWQAACLERPAENASDAQHSLRFHWIPAPCAGSWWLTRPWTPTRSRSTGRGCGWTPWLRRVGCFCWEVWDFEVWVDSMAKRLGRCCWASVEGYSGHFGAFFVVPDWLLVF